MAQRTKTFEATGQPTEGRLYAGDLNAIQDHYAVQYDFAQTIGLGALHVGDPALQLLKFGEGEFRLTGAAHIDGLVNALGGLVAGEMTTTQRDTLPAGKAPSGIIIFNTTLNIYQWNSGTDAGRIWETLGLGTHAATHLPGGTDVLNYPLINLRGTLAARPAASSTNNGLLYFAYDDQGGTIYRSTGAAWEKVGAAVADSNLGAPTGSITAFGGGSAPGGWVLCNGASYDHTMATYSPLFSVIAYNYGGAGNNFNVPDLRGRMPVGLGTNTDVDTLNKNEGQAVGSRRPKHFHYVNNILRAVGSPWAIVTGAGGWNQTNAEAGPSTNAPQDAPAYLVVNYIIKL